MRPERAKAVAARLVADDMFSGYGIRTMSKRAAGYNPMSYHDGSVWPHDNSLILLGLARLGFREEAKLVLNGLMRAAGSFEYDRLPELFCGYPDSEGLPVPYPVACSPQAWAAGTQISFLQAVLGIEPNGLTRTIGINPVLPDGMNTLLVSGIPIGGGKLSLLLVRDRETEEIAVKMIANTTGYELKMHADAKSISIR
jgi:glycogen debranching enzyme